MARRKAKVGTREGGTVGIREEVAKLGRNREKRCGACTPN